MPSSYTSLVYHIVFGTKEQRHLIAPEIAPELHAYMGGIISHLGGRPILIGGVTDHVHVLTILNQKRALEDVLRDLKANSTRWIHQRYPELAEFVWQAGYGAFTVGIRGMPQVKAYIQGQQAHHREVGFREEFREFLQVHGIDFDERYLL
ncbi:MAG: IS200/IS605 family transposase [Armatimonadota bacterium]